MRLQAIRSLLSNRNYAIYTAGNAISLTGTWIQSIAFSWLVWEMTKSPFWLGIVGTAGLVPTLFGGLLGGVLADRKDRMRLTAVSQVVCFALTFVLFLLYEARALNVWILIAFKISLSMVVAISQPARMALIPNLVGKDQLGPAVSFGSMVFNTARFVGPAVAGFILAHGGTGMAFLANSLSFLVMSVAILCLRLPPGAMLAAPTGRGRTTMRGDLKSSLAYVWAHGGVSALFLLVLAVVVFARPISDFLPAIVTSVYGRGVGAVAILTSSIAAGSFLGGLWTAGREVTGLTRSALLACAAYACCIAAFVLTTNFWIGCAVFASAGFFTVGFATAAQTLVQVSVEDGMRGRVMSLWFILSRGGPDLGAFVMGIAGSLAGLQNAFIGGAVLVLAATLWAWRRRSALATSLETTQAPA